MDDNTDPRGIQKTETTHKDGGKTYSNKYIKGHYKEHYGKTMGEVDAENKYILDTQSKCLDFVQKFKGHRAVCNWCKQAEEPEIIWKWDPTENVWYRYYDGDWHYWGPSKDGFTTEGWTWHKGYWHHDGYVFKYEDNKWKRFQGKRWTDYDKSVPVSPEKPDGKEICRPFYILEKKGFPESLTTTKIPRCQVGDDTYMWEDEANCKFLGGKQIMVDHMVCKDGQSHKWKKVVKCVKGPAVNGAGFDYKTGKLMKNLYSFSQCELVQGGADQVYLVLFGQCHAIPNRATYEGIWGKTDIFNKITAEQLKTCPQGQPLSDGAHLVAEGEKNYLVNNGAAMQIDSKRAMEVCKFKTEGI